jgi:hypothetical protein
LDRTLRPESLPVRVASSRRTAQRGDPFVEHAVAERLRTTVESPTSNDINWRSRIGTSIKNTWRFAIGRKYQLNR